MNPRKMQQMMQKMGIQQVEIDASQVIIKCPDKEIVIDNPQVSKVNMMGQETFQVVGEAEERALDTTPDINGDDIQAVVDQAGCSEEEAQKALEETKGDLAEAILKLKGE